MRYKQRGRGRRRGSIESTDVYQAPKLARYNDDMMHRYDFETSEVWYGQCGRAAAGRAYHDVESGFKIGLA